MSEPNAGSDVVSMRLKAEKKGKATRQLEEAEKQTRGEGIAVAQLSLLGSQYRFSAAGPQFCGLNQDRRLQQTASILPLP